MAGGNQTAYSNIYPELSVKIFIYLTIISDNVSAVSDVWIISDEFLRSVISSLQGMKTETLMDNKHPPFIYNYYNVFCYFQSPLSNVKSIATRILNAMIEGLNERVCLPRYILILTDIDIIKYINKYDYMVGYNIKDMIVWLAKNIKRSLEGWKDDLKCKRAGTISISAELRIVWVQALYRPPDMNNKEVFSLIAKYNQILVDVIQIDEHAHFMDITTVNEYEHFDKFGQLTNSGKRKFWKAINEKLKSLDRGDINLQPWKSNNNPKLGEINHNTVQKENQNRQRYQKRKGAKWSNY